MEGRQSLHEVYAGALLPIQLLLAAIQQMVLIMRHPKAVAMTKALINGLMG